MALMMGKLHAALVSAGVEPNAAREAAEEVAAYDHELREIKATQKLHSGMLAKNSVLLLAVLGKLLLLH
jgi:hypothetical protein